MALTTLNTGAISFKKLSGKAHTQQTFAVTEEGIATNVQVSYSTVFANPIEKLPVTNSGLTTLYSTNGRVERIKFEIDIIPDTQIAVGRSQGYRLKLPSDYNTHPGKLYPKFVAGTYLHNGLGKLQIVPTLYGQLKPDGTTEYDPILYQTNGSTVIAKFDPINWYLDPYSGVLFVQDPPTGYDSSAARPGFIEAFLYVGDYIDDLLSSTMSGSTGTTASNVGIGAGVFKNKVGQDLRFKSISGSQGITVTGTTNDIIIAFTGATGGNGITGATNGLTRIGNNAILGGDLTTDVFINPLNTGISATISFGNIVPLANFSAYSPSSYINIDDTNTGIGNSPNNTINNALSMSVNGIILQNSLGSLDFFNNTVNLHADSSAVNGLQIDSYSSAGISLINNHVNGQTLISGQFGFSGMTYDQDYSYNFGPRSIPDVAWVLNNMSGSTGSTLITGATNGVKISGKNVVLGGDLTGDTEIYGTGSFSLGPDGNLNFYPNQNISFGGVDVNFTNSGNLNIYSTAFRIFTDTTINGNITMNGDFNNSTMNYDLNTAIFTDLRPTGFTTGIRYADDYSIGFEKYSLVDVNWVTGLTTNFVVNGTNNQNVSILTNDSTSLLFAYDDQIIGSGSLEFIPFSGMYWKNYEAGGLTGNATSINQYAGGSVTISSNISTFQGLMYEGDYSANFGPRSIPDVAWVTGHTSGSSAPQNIYGAKVIITGSTTLNSSNFVVFCNAFIPINVNTPSSPVNGQVFKIKDVSNTAGTNNITINGNGKLIDGSATITINTNRGGVEICYDSTLGFWSVMNFVG